MNAGQRVSDRVDVAPDAAVTDGLLDVVVVRVATVGRLLHTIARLAVGRPVPPDDIVRGRAGGSTSTGADPSRANSTATPAIGSDRRWCLRDRRRCASTTGWDATSAIRRNRTVVRQGVDKIPDDP